MLNSAGARFVMNSLLRLRGNTCFFAHYNSPDVAPMPSVLLDFREPGVYPSLHADFADKTAGGVGCWTSRPAFNMDDIVETFSNVPGEMIDTGAKMLKPIENYFGSNLIESWLAACSG